MMALTVKMIKQLSAFLLSLAFLTFFFNIHYPLLKNTNYLRIPLNYNWANSIKEEPVTRQKQTDNLTYSGVDEYIRYTVSRLGLKPTNSSLPFVINELNFQYSINPSHRCLKSLQVFVVIVSAPNYFEKRKLIRKTWASHLTKMKRHGRESWSGNYAFLMGKTDDNQIQEGIEEENLKYQDIIQVDLVDSYNNLTLKSVALLQWSQQHCSNAQFILKCDDDVYVNTNYLATAIKRLPTSSSYIYGCFVGNTYPIRNEDNKWSVSREVWPWLTYPSYILGGSYLIDGSAIASLVEAVKMTPYFPFEDVYINGLCARKAGVKLMASYRMLNAVVDPSDDLIGNYWLVNNAVMWLTDSNEEMVASHLAVELDLIKNNLIKKHSSVSRKTKFPKIDWVLYN